MSVNQCDGCRRGIPVNENGVHVGPAGFRGGDFMACTADRYAPYVPEEIRRLPETWNDEGWNVDGAVSEFNHGYKVAKYEDADALAKAIASKLATCEWHKPDPEDEFYETACGSAWEAPAGMLIEEMPTMRYCSNCGRRIRIVS